VLVVLNRCTVVLDDTDSPLNLRSRWLAHNIPRPSPPKFLDQFPFTLSSNRPGTLVPATLLYALPSIANLPHSSIHSPSLSARPMLDLYHLFRYNPPPFVYSWWIWTPHILPFFFMSYNRVHSLPLTSAIIRSYYTPYNDCVVFVPRLFRFFPLTVYKLTS
jgi:hypothetical protein